MKNFQTDLTTLQALLDDLTADQEGPRPSRETMLDAQWSLWRIRQRLEKGATLDKWSREIGLQALEFAKVKING